MACPAMEQWRSTFTARTGLLYQVHLLSPLLCVRKVGNSEALTYFLPASNVLLFFTLGSVQDRGGSGSATSFSFTYLLVTGMSGQTETKGNSKRIKAAQGSFAF